MAIGTLRDMKKGRLRAVLRRVRPKAVTATPADAPPGYESPKCDLSSLTGDSCPRVWESAIPKVFELDGIHKTELDAVQKVELDGHSSLAEVSPTSPDPVSMDICENGSDFGGATNVGDRSSKISKAKPQPFHVPRDPSPNAGGYLVPNHEQRRGTFLSQSSSNAELTGYGNTQAGAARFIVSNAFRPCENLNRQSGINTATRSIPLRCSISNNKTGEHAEMFILYDERNRDARGALKIEGNIVKDHGGKGIVNDENAIREWRDFRVELQKEQNEMQRLLLQQQQLRVGSVRT